MEPSQRLQSPLLTLSILTGQWDYGQRDTNYQHNTTHHLHLQLDRFHTYTAPKGPTLIVHKTKTMAFFCSNPPIFRYSGTQLENVQECKYLGTTLSHTGKMTIALNQMARNFAGAIARVWRICSGLGIKNRKHAMLWIFQVFALSAGF